MYVIDSRNILTPQNGLNIYRGRTENHILLTEIPGADPMDIGVKTDAPELLSKTLRTRRSKCMIVMGNLGDPYNSLDETYGLTRKCLKVIENQDFGVIISTRQERILRDIDVIAGIASKTKGVVEMTFPCMDEEKRKLIEGEETIPIADRLRIAGELKKAGITVVASISPIIPFVNDDQDELLDMIRHLSNIGIDRIDMSDMRMVIKKSLRDFFYNEFKNRFPSEYASFIHEHEAGGELYPRDKEELQNVIYGFCQDKGIMYDSKQITSWKRQYVNRTVGEQMSLF
ncbi:MAG: hypothetical protein IKS48_02535 [Eubacterium sp.]|nr:hypothetical protein [Eubacterium sp.]